MLLVPLVEFGAEEGATEGAADDGSADTGLLPPTGDDGDAEGVTEEGVTEGAEVGTEEGAVLVVPAPGWIPGEALIGWKREHPDFSVVSQLIVNRPKLSAQAE